MTALIVGSGIALAVALVVMVYVAFPGRGKRMAGPAGAAGDALAKLADSVRPEEEEVPRHGLLGNPETDAVMRERVNAVGRHAAAPFTKVGEMLRDVGSGRQTSEGDTDAPQ